MLEIFPSININKDVTHNITNFATVVDFGVEVCRNHCHMTSHLRIYRPRVYHEYMKLFDKRTGDEMLWVLVVENC